MIVKIFRHSFRITKFCLEMLAVAATVSVLAAAILFWRLSQGPFDVSFAQSYIEAALSDRDAGLQVKLPNVVLSWPTLRGPMMLQAKNGAVVQNGRPLLQVAQARIGLSTLYLLAGQIVPTSIELSGPALHLTRAPDRTITLGLAAAKTAPMVSVGDWRDLTRQLTQAPGAGRWRLLQHLRLIRVTDADLVVEDRVRGVTSSTAHMDFSFARTWQGLEMAAHLPLPDGRDQPAAVDVQAHYRRAGDNFAVSARFNDVAAPLLASCLPPQMPGTARITARLAAQTLYLDGTARAQFDSALHVTAADVQVTTERARLDLPELYAHGLALDHAAVAAHYDAARGEAVLDGMTVQAGGATAMFEAPLTLDARGAHGKIALALPELPQKAIATLWPDRWPPGPAQRWLVQKMADGAFRHVRAAALLDLRRQADGVWRPSWRAATADFDIDNMTVDYRAPLLPARQVMAHAHLADNVLDVAVKSAAVGALRVTQGDLRIDNIGAVGKAALNLQIAGKLPDVFAYIAPPPIGIGAGRLGMDTTKMQGEAALKVGISLPTVRDLTAAQVKVAVQGDLRHVVLPGVVRGLDVRADLLKLQVAEGAAAVTGGGTLDGHPINFSWRQAMQAAGGQIEAALVVDDALRAKLDLPTAGMISGPVPARIQYAALADGQAMLDVQADATAAEIALPALAYAKKAGETASLQGRARLLHGKLTGIEALQAQAPDLRVLNGAVNFADGKFTNAQASQVQLHETRAAVKIARNAAGAWQVDVQGPFVDASPFLARKTAAPYSGPPVVARVTAEQLRTKADQVVQKAKVLADLGGDGLFNRLEVQAVAGAGPLSVQLRPDARGVMNVQVRAADAGAALRAFGIYNNLLGGRLTIDGAADPAQPRTLAGLARLRDFRVVHGPVLARLISAISPLSLLQSLDGDGIPFSLLESKFTWTMRPGGDLYVLSDGRTAGNSLGLTFAGTIDKQQDAVKIEGNVIPLSGVNGLVGDIPLLGNLLTGASKNGALFAANYTVSGPVANPSVSVNPLSVLAPGIFRRILFGGD